MSIVALFLVASIVASILSRKDSRVSGFLFLFLLRVFLAVLLLLLLLLLLDSIQLPPCALQLQLLLHFKVEKEIENTPLSPAAALPI